MPQEKSLPAQITVYRFLYLCIYNSETTMHKLHCFPVYVPHAVQQNTVHHCHILQWSILLFSQLHFHCCTDGIWCFLCFI